MVRKFTLPFPQGYGVRAYRIGCNNRPFYLIAAMPKKVYPSHYPQFRPDEVIGSIDPMPNEHGELLVSCDLQRLCYYLGKGARLSGLLEQYLALAGFWPLNQRLLVNSWRHRDGKLSRRGIRPMILPTPREEHLKQILEMRKELLSIPADEKPDEKEASAS